MKTIFLDGVAQIVYGLGATHGWLEFFQMRRGFENFWSAVAAVVSLFRITKKYRRFQSGENDEHFF